MTRHGPASPDRPTLEVVAARAGVSRATASRVLRGSSNVSAEARESVLRAADEISYTVNRAARSLVTRRSDTIAFFVAENEDRMFHDPYFLGVLRGAQAEAAAAGLQLIFAVASTEAETRQFTHFVGGGHVDGVLLVSLHGDDRLADALEATGVPTVINGRPFAADTPLFSVDSDNVAGGQRGDRTAHRARRAADRDHHRAAGHERRPGSADRLPAGVARRGALPAAPARRRRRLHRRGRLGRDGHAAGRGPGHRCGLRRLRPDRARRDADPRRTRPAGARRRCGRRLRRRPRGTVGAPDADARSASRSTSSAGR